MDQDKKVGTHTVRTALDFVGHVTSVDHEGTIRFTRKYNGVNLRYTVKVEPDFDLDTPNPFTVVGELTAVETPEGVKLV
jgi:hypothetical protein